MFKHLTVILKKEKKKGKYFFIMVLTENAVADPKLSIVYISLSSEGEKMT